ncbi:hypothetical protein FL858_04665 [Listeria monocytogenes]|nr:hypothetical protein [Listeria monocytogenes]
MTKLWHTEKFESFHSGVKNFTKNILIDLKDVSEKQKNFVSSKRGMESETFKSAQSYVREVHLNIVDSLKRAIDEYNRVVDKLERSFASMVDAAGHVKISTEMLAKLNRETDLKVEDIYQAHKELKKRIETCNSDINTVTISGPSFVHLEDNMNKINNQLTNLQNKMSNYDSSQKDGFKEYHQLVIAIRNAIDRAKTNYTAPNGSINYTTGAFGNSLEGKELSSANFQVEKAKIDELYTIEDGKLNNMTAYANGLLQDPNRLDRELERIAEFLQTHDFDGNIEERHKWSALYGFLEMLKMQKNKFKEDTKDFKVLDLKIDMTSVDKYVITGNYQTFSEAEWNKRAGVFKETYGGDYRLIKFTVTHYGNEFTITGDMNEEEVKKLNDKLNSNNADWAIPIINTAVGFVPGLGSAMSVAGGGKEFVEKLSEDERVEQEIATIDLKSTAETFKMTVTISEIPSKIPGSTDSDVNLIIVPSPTTHEILQRWKDISNNLSEKQKYPVNNEKMNYVELYKYFQEAEMGRSTEKYILTGEW